MSRVRIDFSAEPCPGPTMEFRFGQETDETIFVDEWGHKLSDEEVDEYLKERYPDWSAGAP